MAKNITFKQVLKMALMIWVALICVFAFLSGAEEYDEGLIGVIKNSPNALPWVILLAILWLTRKKDLWQGAFLVIIGVASIIAFNFFESMLVFVLIPLPLIVVGSVLLFSWYTAERK